MPKQSRQEISDFIAEEKRTSADCSDNVPNTTTTLKSHKSHLFIVTSTPHKAERALNQ